MPREVDGGLSGGVAAADQCHFGAGAHLRFERRGPVPDAATLEAPRRPGSRPAVAGTAGDDHGTGRHRAAVDEVKPVGAGGAEADELDDARGKDDVGAELLGLDEGASGSALPVMPVGKPR